MRQNERAAELARISAILRNEMALVRNVFAAAAPQGGPVQVSSNNSTQVSLEHRSSRLTASCEGGAIRFSDETGILSEITCRANGVGLVRAATSVPVDDLTREAEVVVHGWKSRRGLSQ